MSGTNFAAIVGGVFDPKVIAERKAAAEKKAAEKAAREQKYAEHQANRLTGDSGIGVGGGVSPSAVGIAPGVTGGDAVAGLIGLLGAPSLGNAIGAGIDSANATANAAGAGGVGGDGDGGNAGGDGTGGGGTGPGNK